MQTFGLILIFLAIFLLIVIYYIIVYNKIQSYKTKIDHVEGIIDETLRAKYDHIIKIEDCILKNLKEKKAYLKELRDLKKEKISNFELNRKLTEAEGIVENLYHDNDNLKDNDAILKVFEEQKLTNEKLMAGILYYNKHTSSLNNYIRKFPNNIIAKIHHVKVKPYFDGKDMTDNDIEDFKL